MAPIGDKRFLMIGRSTVLSARCGKHYSLYKCRMKIYVKAEEKILTITLEVERGKRTSFCVNWRLVIQYSCGLWEVDEIKKSGSGRAPTVLCRGHMKTQADGTLENTTIFKNQRNEAPPHVYSLRS